ncbi:unnamed protein product [Lactuca virosa]|uniref:SWIM-type domain-containing protein n=1 Tax=Lactuca virosa TaxID=75947 RepID=A0AAU9M3P6_9ASTR|nr:unnamed protein product [Lactuca virosa]
MLEEIRLYVMERQFNLTIKGCSWPDYKPCPVIIILLNQLKRAQRYRQVLPTGLNQFETRNLAESYVVDIDKKTCSCRVWQLNGYGCVHSVATISYLNSDVGNYVDPMYYGAIYKNTYKYPMCGMNGSNMWSSTKFIAPLPPLKRKMQGRPKVNRRKDASERGARHTVSKVGKKVKKRKRADGNDGEGSSGKKAMDVTDEQGTRGNKGSNGNDGEGSSGKKAIDVTDEQGTMGNKGNNGDDGKGRTIMDVHGIGVHS